MVIRVLVDLFVIMCFTTRPLALILSGEAKVRQQWRWAVALTVTSQTGASQVYHVPSKQAKDDPLSKKKAQKQAWTRIYKEWYDQQEQKPHLLWMLLKGSYGQRLPKQYHS
jgi:hypothetical protein